MFEIINLIPSIIRLLIIFILIALMLKIKFPLALAMFIGSILAFFLFKPDVSIIPKVLDKSILSFEVVSLVVVIFLILTFSGILKVSGRLKHITDDFENAFGSGSTFFIIFPSVIGLLPMPGGAIFSAPMIEQKGLKEGFSPERLSAINYWFRHVWEIMWFLYPGIIISSSIFNVNVWEIVVLHLPITIISLFSGWFFLLRKKIKGKSHIKWNKIPAFLKGLLPILILIISNILLQVILSALNIPYHKNVIMSFCLLGSIIFVLITDKPNWKVLIKEIFNVKMLSMIVLIFLIFVFKETLSETNAITNISNEVKNDFKLPFMLIITSLPFIVGLSTGITVGFVSLTFPVIASIYSSSFSNISVYSISVLSYTVGVIGILLSPLHICLVLTKDYFKATLLGTLKEILFPLLIMLSSGVGLYFLYDLIW